MKVFNKAYYCVPGLLKGIFNAIDSKLADGKTLVFRASLWKMNFKNCVINLSAHLTFVRMNEKKILLI